MKRRHFLALATASAAVAPFGQLAVAAEKNTIRWTQSETSHLFTQVECGSRHLARSKEIGLLAGIIKIKNQHKVVESVVLSNAKESGRRGPLRVGLSHKLRDSGLGQSEDLLEAVLTMRNTGNTPIEVESGFATSAQPWADVKRAQAYLPLSIAGMTRDQRFAAIGCEEMLSDCWQPLENGQLECHYLEPMASVPWQRTTKALLLAPVVDISHPESNWHVAIFTPSDQPVWFKHSSDASDSNRWSVGRHQTINSGEEVQARCFLLLHQGDASSAWGVFHQFAHNEDYSVPDWAHDFRVHYFDFLSSAEGQNARRGDGYDADLKHFRQFHVGMATQHGYYPAIGDFIDPDRKVWQAMQGDTQGAVGMSLETMRGRIRATRDAGARAAVYIHPVLFDGGGPLYEHFSDSIAIDAEGKPIPFNWSGPDMIGQGWRMSLSSPVWRVHLLQQTEWIMELLSPDAIVIDETFAGLGYDEHPDRSGPMAQQSIELYRQMRSIVKSHGTDRALFSSDCSRTNFVMWTDGDAGDHAYSNSLGNPLFMQEPVRYLAALGDKPWRPCAWHFQGMWQHQMALARKVGAGVGVSNGWAEYTGLHKLSADDTTKLISDIKTLL